MVPWVWASRRGMAGAENDHMRECFPRTGPAGPHPQRCYPEPAPMERSQVANKRSLAQSMHLQNMVLKQKDPQNQKISGALSSSIATACVRCGAFLWNQKCYCTDPSCQFPKILRNSGRKTSNLHCVIV